MGDFFMDKNFLTKNKRKYILITAVIIGVYLSMKYLSPVVSPFILAFLIAGALNKLTGKIPLKIKNSMLAGVILLLFCAVFLVLAWIIGAFVVKRCGEAAGQIAVYEKDFSQLLGNCCDRMEYQFGVDGDAIESFVLEQVNIFIENLEVKILPAVMNKGVGYAKSIVSFAGFIAVTIIAVFLILKDYEHIVDRARSNRDFKGIFEVANKIVLYIKTFIKAQLVILLIISTICAVTLGMIGMEGGIFYGMFTGFMDMLPFIGTGIMLVPLAFYQLLLGSYGRGVVILCLYGVCALLREFLEPKLIGNKVGIWPVGILFAVFAGVKLFGVLGIIKGPIGLVIICETCKYLFEESAENR